MKKLFSLFIMTVLCVSAKADNWMSRLPDDAPVCVLSIPGSHDTATGNGFTDALGPFFGLTQDLSIQEQWAIGVRAFDLRPCVSKSELRLNHGICPTTLTLTEAFNVLRDSLAANPSEFAIIHLEHETDGDSNSSDFESLLHSVMESSDYQGLFVDYRRDLTVGDMRGKVLVLYRDSYSTAPVGGLMTGWAYNKSDWNSQTAGKIKGAGSGLNATGTLYSQDYCETAGDEALATKLSIIENMLDYSTKHYAYNSRRNVWIFNLASGYTFSSMSTSAGYRANASYTNKAIVDYLSSHSGPTGIIMADYVGRDSSGYFITLKEQYKESLAESSEEIDDLDNYVDSIIDALKEHIKSNYDEDEESAFELIYGDFATMGAQLVNAIIENNFKYLTSTTTERGDTVDVSSELGVALDATDGTSGWTTSNIATNSSQHWSDDPTDYYFEMTGSLWSSATKWTATMTKTISVEDGLYRLKAAGRSSSGALCTMDLNGTSYSFPAQGDTGGTMDIDGVEWESIAIGKAAGATFANNGAGRGWSWGSVDALVTDGKLTVTVTLQNTSGSQYQWASIDDFQLLYLGTSTEALDELIEQASELNTTANLGDGLFQFPTTVASNLATALATAKQVDENPDATQDEVQAALAALQAAYDTYIETALNEPEDGQLYNIITSEGKPLSFHADQTAKGGYAFDSASELNPLRGQAFCLTPSSALKDGYTVSFTGTDGKAHYLYNASTAALSTDSATVFQVKATTEEGSWDIEGLASGLSFSEAELVSVTTTLVADTCATLILPFYASLPEGVRAYSCSALESDGQTLSLTEESALEANTPYIICCPTGEAPAFEGAGTWHESCSLAAGLLTGTMEETTLAQGAYVLKADGDDGEPVFSRVTSEAGETLAAFQCSLSLGSAESLPDVLYLTMPVVEEEEEEGEVEEGGSGEGEDEEVGEGEDEGDEEVGEGEDEGDDEEGEGEGNDEDNEGGGNEGGDDVDTSVNTIEGESRQPVYYDMTGRKVQTTPQRGLYIRDGKKVLVK
ncbi:MAG: hypothetical protein LUC86_03010 [Prevotellaceae bacterium]|nr:hypothetical protein [Prevotellaceae bacterium]